MKLLRHSLPAALLGALVLASPAAAGLSSWTHWTAPAPADDAHVRAFASSGPELYAGTEGDGVVRSTNAGVSWAPMGGLTGAAANVRALYVDGGAVFAGTTTGLYKSSGGGAFTRVAEQTLDKPVQTVLKTSAGYLAGVASGGVYRSGDGGTWSKPAPGNGMVASETVWGLTAHPTTPNLVLAATQSGVYRSTDGGATWELRTDGLPYATTLRVHVDASLPNVYYVSTVGRGVWRTVDAGTSWHPIGLDGETVRALHLGSGVPAKLWAATGKGVYATRATDLANPSTVIAPSWRQVTTAGLGDHTIAWALTQFVTPGTLFVGTQGGGASHLTFQPPVNQTAPVLSDTTPAVGQTLTASDGTWGGTPEFSFAHQWERCQNGSCTPIDGAKGPSYVVGAADQGKGLRVVVTAENDFPTAGLVTKPSATSSNVAAKPGSLPGDAQQSAPTFPLTALAVGDVVPAPAPSFNPSATTLTRQWLRCATAQLASCVDIPGATGATYQAVTEDAGQRLGLRVTGTNGAGSKTLTSANLTNEVQPEPAAALAPPSVVGDAVVGQSLVGLVGAWKSPKTTFERQWLRCDGASCTPIAGATGPTYVPTAADVGRQLRLRVRADVNEGYKLPAGVEVQSAPTATIAAAGQGGGGTGGGGGQGGDGTAPVLGGVKLKGTALVLSSSEPVQLRLTLTRSAAGKRKGASCVKPARKLRKARTCTRWTPVGKPLARTVAAGATTIAGVAKAVAKRKPAAGRYRLVVAATDAAGNAATPTTVSFTVKRARR